MITMAKQPAALARYWAAKRGGRAKTRTRTIVKTRTRHVAVKAKRRRGGGKSAGPMKLLPVALIAGGMAYLTSSQGPAFVRDNVAKIPGAKTFGNPAAVGLAALAIDRFVKPNRYLKVAGWIGIALAAMAVGSKGTSFKWLGDESTGAYELEGDDDVGDDLEDLEGDDD